MRNSPSFEFSQELKNLRSSLQESENTTAAQQEIREHELAQLQKKLEEETANHEATVVSMKQKHATAFEDLSERLEEARKVRKGKGQDRKYGMHTVSSRMCSIHMLECLQANIPAVFIRS